MDPPPREISAPLTLAERRAVRWAVWRSRLRPWVLRGWLPLSWAAWVLDRVRAG